MIQSSQDASFTLKAAKTFIIASKLFGQSLEATSRA
jgi:hypothetical protein